MITEQALLNKTPNLYGTEDRVYANFQEYDWGEVDEDHKLPDNLKLLYADYTYEDYSGDAYVLGYNTELGKFFEVHGSHCSCYGLENQWDEEYFDDYEQLKVVILKRVGSEDFGCDFYYRSASASQELAGFLEITKEDVSGVI